MLNEKIWSSLNLGNPTRFSIFIYTLLSLRLGTLSPIYFPLFLLITTEYHLYLSQKTLNKRISDNSHCFFKKYSGTKAGRNVVLIVVYHVQVGASIRFGVDSGFGSWSFVSSPFDHKGTSFNLALFCFHLILFYAYNMSLISQ